MKKISFVILLLWLACPLSGQSGGTIFYSRDSKKLNTGGTPDLMTYNPATGEHRLLIKGTRARRGEYNPALSPDGKKIIFNTYRFGGWKLGIGDYDNGKVSNVRRFTNRPNYEYEPSWSNDGQKVIYDEYNWGTNRSGFFIWNRATGTIKALKQTRLSGSTLHWTHDDRQVIFASEKGKTHDIFRVDLYTEEVENISEHAAHDMAPSCSPVSARMAFLSNRQGKLLLYSANLDGSDLKCLTPDLNSDSFHYSNWQDSGSWAYKTSWSPEGKQIVFTVPVKGQLHLFMVNADGSNLKQITKTGVPISPHIGRVKRAARQFF